MTCRRHGTKSTVAFWMLVAVADLALIVASWGWAAMLLVLAVVLTGVAAWRIVSRGAAEDADPVVPAVVRVESRRGD